MFVQIQAYVFGQHDNVEKAPANFSPFQRLNQLNWKIPIRNDQLKVSNIIV